MQKEGRKEHPHKAAIIGVIKFINKNRIEGHKIIVCINSNEYLTHDKRGISKLCKECKLNDPLDNRHSGMRNNKTQQEGSVQIYIILCSFNVLKKLKRNGTTAFNEIISSNYRYLYIDLSREVLLKNLEITIPSSQTEKVHQEEYHEAINWRENKQN